ncbi:hypothetical protein KP509_06G089000 [Ceratopteris richardii]|uniref:DUF7880 domain-containing protein n=1 Tax=Ceratopteris richardii TaxID=49495 RepID=A0A8T2UIR1_CERRI|nr:hypothetical protein KP509_06G089000 [Ceratopteris richardii]
MNFNKIYILNFHSRSSVILHFVVTAIKRRVEISMASTHSFQSYYMRPGLHIPSAIRVRRGFQVRALDGESHLGGRNDRVSFISRRDFACLGVNLIYLSTLAAPADADDLTSGPFSKYIKRKKLDPLDTYIPPVLLSQLQFQDLETKLLSDKPDYSDSRSFLRSGPASALRTNIRAVAQYASEAGDGKGASEAVRECISSIEDLDSLLLRASRNDTSATVQKMKEKIDASVAALDKLLTTVPASILEKGRAIAASYRKGTDLSNDANQADADAKLLESLL